MINRVRCAAGFVVALALAAVGCSSSNSSSSSGGGGNQVSSAACQTCLNTNCSTQGAACTSTACVTFANCANACTSEACIQSCLANNPDPGATGLSTCFNTSCASCLTTPTPAVTGTVNPTACPAAATDQPCDTCLKQHCCPQITACDGDQTCVSTAQQCSASCTDLTCLTSCAQQSGDTAAINLAACDKSACSTCGNAGGSSGGSSGGSGSGSGGGSCTGSPTTGSAQPQGCLAVPAGLTDCACITGQTNEHDCENGPPAGYNCTSILGATSGLYCCDR